MTRMLVDSNILVYAALKEQGNKHVIAVETIAELIEKNDMVVSTQNLAELTRVLLEKVEPSIHVEIVRQILFGYALHIEIVPYTHATIINALAIKKEYNIHFFDALLVATMQENGIDEIITENTKDFSRIPWLRIKNPFEK